MMNERVKKIRLSENLNQSEFADKINISRSHLSLIENGVRSVTDRVISDICREFNINENWLRSGEGEMIAHPQTTREKLDKLIEDMDYEELKIMSNFIDCMMEIKAETMQAIPIVPELTPIVDDTEDDAFIVRAAHNDNEDPDQVEKMNNDISRLEEKARKRKLER